MALEQIRARTRRYTINATIVIIFALLTAAITIIAIKQQSEQLSADIQSNGYTVSLPDGLKLRDAIKVLAQQDNFTADFRPNCTDSLMNTEIEAATLKGKSTIELIELLRLHLKNPQRGFNYQVTKIQDKGVYEISCTN